ncbi:MAG: helix-turn-helix transcriptional regulator [Christensenellales bacterium]|jgi:AraC-like DNA-binding protein
MRRNPTETARVVEIHAIHAVSPVKCRRGESLIVGAPSHWTLLSVEQGAMESLAQGQMMLLAPGAPRAFAIKSAVCATQITFDGDSTVLFPLAGKAYTMERAQGYLAQMRGEVRSSKSFGRAQYLHLLLEMVIIELARRAMQPPTLTPPADGAGARHFERAAAYIEAHISSSLSLEEISAHTGVSASHLGRLFRARTGLGAIQYCRLRRVERAKSLMRAGGMSMTAIAEATGFASVHYFSRTFKQISGMPPREYLRFIKSADKSAY